MTTAKKTEETVADKNIIQLITEVKKAAGALAPAQSSGVPFPFRGIDGTVNHLAKHIEAAGIVVVPQVVSHVITERSPDGKRVVKTAQIETDFTFYAPDGSSVTARTAGLADDFADRASAQAQSVAFRIALLQTFFLPTQSPEPEQTGQAVQDEATKAPSATEQKIEQARRPAAATSDAQAKIRDWIGSDETRRTTVNTAMTRLKATGLVKDALFEAIAKEVGA
jgi:hypothetical protein